MAVTVESTIENIWKNKTEEQFLDVTLTLLKLIQNVLFNPDKQKFKKIKRNTTFFFTNPGVEDFLKVCGFEVRENWMVFLDTEFAFMKIDTGKRQLLSYRKKINSLKAFEVPENSLRYSAIMLGKGKFASVFQGTWENCPVAIKALHPYCTAEAVNDFRREAGILRNLKHNNIIILYAVCLQNVNKRHAHVLELMDRTILDVLRTDPDITTEKLVAKALEVAAGLDHIHSKNILHCDIAARNILLNIQGVVKISDFGLARYSDTPDCLLAGKTTVFPIRWTAPEVFTENILTKASDVWSYGILCYEFITRGKTPYGTFQNRQIKRSVSTGYRLPQSEECPDDLYFLMLKCWNAQPNKRPSFQNIYQDLINMKLNFAKKQRFAVCFNDREDNNQVHVGGNQTRVTSPDLLVSTFRRQSIGMRASIRKLVRSVSGKRATNAWTNDIGDETLTIYTTLVQTSTAKITVHCKKDARGNDIIKKALAKLGHSEKDTYKYAIVEVFDPHCGNMRRSQPALNTNLEDCTPYAKLRGLMEQLVILRSSWKYKEQTRYVLCPRGAILRVMELYKSVQDGVKVGLLPFETRGYLLQSTGLVSGRNSMMWRKIWGTLDGISFGIFDDEDCEDTWNDKNVVTVQHASVSGDRNDIFILTDSNNMQYSFQADDREDAWRWVEAINAAQAARAPESGKLSDSTILHCAKVLVTAEVENDTTLHYGNKQVTLRKDEMFFYHNGERLSGQLERIAEIAIVQANHSYNTYSSTTEANGLKLVFCSGTIYHLYPASQHDLYTWTSAFHKAAVFCNKSQIIQLSNMNELMKSGNAVDAKVEVDAGLKSPDISTPSGSCSPDSGVLTACTPSPDFEDSFADLNKSITIEDVSRLTIAEPRPHTQLTSSSPNTDHVLPPSTTRLTRAVSPPTPLPTLSISPPTPLSRSCSTPPPPPGGGPPLPPRNKLPFVRTASTPGSTCIPGSTRPLPAIPGQST